MERHGSRLPEFYYNTYRQYKENDGEILSWVHMTAAELQERKATSAIPQPDGRSRKAGTNKKHNSSPSSSTGITTPQIPLSIFLKNVREIAASDAIIPTSYLSLLELSIKQRKITAAFYSPDVQASDKNKSHLFAISAYTQALEILKEAQRKRAETDQDLAQEIQSALSVRTEVENDWFALSETIHQLALVLKEEEIGVSASVGSPENEWLRDNPMLSASKGAKKYKKPRPFPLDEYEVVPDDYFATSKKPKLVADDSFEALRCFLLDVHHIRVYCKEIWSSVAPVGQTSHIAASFITNQAVQIIKKMEYSLYANFPSLKDKEHAYGNLLDFVKSQAPNARERELYPLKEQMLYYTWHMLKEFSEVIKHNPVPVLRDGHWGHFDPLAKRDAMLYPEKKSEDRCIMGNHWLDLILLIRYTDSFIGSHGLFEEYRAFYKDKSHYISWALIFACQLQADSVVARRLYLDYDLKIMRNLGDTIMKEYEDFLLDGVLYATNIDMFAIPHIKEQQIHIARWLQSDPLGDMKQQYSFDKLSKQAFQKDAIWLQNSWLTANAISEATMKFFFAGTAVVAAAGFLQSAVQLWNMLKQTGYLTRSSAANSGVLDTKAYRPKADILLFDHLMDVFGDKIFSGPPPKSGFLKQWGIMMGVRPEEFASGKRQYKKGTRQSHQPRAHNEMGRGILVTISDLFNLHSADYFPTRDIKDSGQELQHPLAATLNLVNAELGLPAVYMNSKGPQDPQKSGKKKETRNGPLLNLNLFKIHHLCVRIFTELEPVIRPIIEQMIGEPMKHTQINWPALTGWIARTEILPGNNGLPNRAMLKRAADVVERIAGDKILDLFLINLDGSKSSTG